MKIYKNVELWHHMQENPQMHFFLNVANVGELISELTCESIWEGCESIAVDLLPDGWWCVKLKKDWITPLNVQKYFHSFIKLDTGIVSGTGRVGIKLGAFTTDLTFVNQTDNSFVIKGKAHCKIELKDFSCCILFRMKNNKRRPLLL